MQNPEIQLFQAEWCPSSHRVRERLTEYGIDFMARQVPAEPGDRTLLLERTGTSGIPTLLLADGSVVAGVESILQHIESIDPQPPSVQEHRSKAARVRAQQLEKELA